MIDNLLNNGNIFLMKLANGITKIYGVADN